MMVQLGKERFRLVKVFPRPLTVPDSFVVRDNKIRTTESKARESHGEAKLYVASKETMRSFYGPEGFCVSCFVLKQDLIDYLNVLKNEYFSPSQNYRGIEKFQQLWSERMRRVMQLQQDRIDFEVIDQRQIQGNRGYVSSSGEGYRLIREISLPLVSFILIKKLVDTEGKDVYYWKLFVDFEAIEHNKSLPLVFSYGRRNTQAGAEREEEDIVKASQIVKRGRDGQQKFRQKLLEQCPYCPFTKVTDDRLLIASHIKPWAVASEKERVDPYNGFMFTPTYDYLFDKGFITFTEDRKVHVSPFLSSHTCGLLGLKEGEFVQLLPMDTQRIRYLEFHRRSVFKD